MPKAANIAITFSLRAAGDSRFPAIVGSTLMWTVGLGAALTLAFGVGWTYLVLAEVVVLERGLGSLVAIAQRRGPREHIYLVILIITLIAWTADLLWARVGYLLFPYRRGQS